MPELSARVQELEALLKRASMAEVAANNPTRATPIEGKGWKVFHKAILDTLINEALPSLVDKSSKVKTIITAGQPDKKRKTFQLDNIGLEADELGKAYERFLSNYEKVSERHMLSTVACIHSLPGCQRQKVHWDFDVDEVRRRLNDGGDLPMSAILALHDGGKLLIYDEDEDVCLEVPLDRGDVIIFCGSVPHAGGSYGHDNMRLHAYINVKDWPKQNDGEPHTWVADLMQRRQPSIVPFLAP